MINLKKNNIFIYNPDKFRSAGSLIEYLKILDLNGFNFIYMHNKRSSLVGSIPVSKIFYQKESLLETINEHNFRLDFILIEPDSVNWTLSELKDLDTPIVYIKRSKTPNQFIEWDNALLFSAEPMNLSQTLSSKMYDDGDKLEDYYVETLGKNNKFTLSDLLKRQKRKSIISDILNSK
jgi:hypothetical protein